LITVAVVADDVSVTVIDRYATLRVSTTTMKFTIVATDKSLDAFTDRYVYASLVSTIVIVNVAVYKVEDAIDPLATAVDVRVIIFAVVSTTEAVRTIDQEATIDPIRMNVATTDLTHTNVTAMTVVVFMIDFIPKTAIRPKVILMKTFTVAKGSGHHQFVQFTQLTCLICNTVTVRDKLLCNKSALTLNKMLNAASVLIVTKNRNLYI
jgi:hypothetical protein